MKRTSFNGNAAVERNATFVPRVSLDAATLGANARAWRAHGGVPLRAVIKSNGYGWGFETLVRALDSEVEGYYVGDADEFDVVRPLTQRPISILLDVPAARVRAILAAGGIPTVSSLASVDAADAWAASSGRRARVRVAVRDAIGWSGVTPPELGGFAALLAERRLDVEVSSHITDASLQAEQTKTFEDALATLRSASVSVVARDLASSAPLAHGIGAQYSYARIGVGLFGAIRRGRRRRMSDRSSGARGGKA